MGQDKTLKVKLPWPPSVNHYWMARGNRRFLSKSAKDWHKEAVYTLLAAKVRFDGPVSVSIEMNPPDRRRRDADNVLKAVMDALVRSQAIKDDSLAFVREITQRLVGFGEGYILVEVREL